MPGRALIALPVLAVVSAVAIAGVADREPAASPTAVPAGGPPVPRLFGIESAGGIELVRVNRRTFRSRPGRRVGLGSQGCASRNGGSACWNVPPWSFSPDRSRLAVARHEGGVVAGLRLIDLARMRTVLDIPIKPSGAVGLVAWPRPGTLLAVQEICCRQEQRLLVVDVDRRTVVARRDLRGTVQGVGRTGRELVLLVAPAAEIGPARLAVVDGRGSVRFASLGGVRAGTAELPGERFMFRHRRPGLAVDPAGRRAYVVDAGLVVSVDLATLTVSSHAPAEGKSLAARIRELLEPTAHAKGASGPTRSARWLGDGRLAVSGADDEMVTDARGHLEQRSRPAGLRLVDTRDWTFRSIDDGAVAVHLAGRLLLATGQSEYLAAGAESTGGLTAYTLDGRRRFARFAGRDAWVEQVAGRHAFVQAGAGTAGTAPEPRVIDLRTGRVSADRPAVLPTLLLEPARSWWDE
jgi:hypothetical protein